MREQLRKVEREASATNQGSEEENPVGEQVVHNTQRLPSEYQKAGVKPEERQRRGSASSGGGQQEGKGCVADGMTYSLAHNTVHCISFYVYLII